jgi:hypothetical protein
MMFKATYKTGKEHTPQQGHNLWSDSPGFGIARFGLKSVQQQKTVKTSTEHDNLSNGKKRSFSLVPTQNNHQYRDP